jgi:hypothetical protein
VAQIREKRNVARILVVKLVERGLLGRPRLSWKDNIEIDLKEVGWNGVDKSGVA